MDLQTQQDVCTVLNALMQTANPSNLEMIERDGGETEQQIHDAMERLGKQVGLEAGLL